MRHTFISAIALMCAMWASTSAFAQWAEPSLPELNEVNATAVEAGHSYFIKNVDAGQFMTGSNEWSTRISLTRSGFHDTYSPALAIYVADSTGTISGHEVTGVSLRLNGTYTVNGNNGQRTFSNTYLFRDEEDVTYIDHGSQDRGYIWKITKADNGYFRIQTADGDPAYPNAYMQYAGWDDSDGEIVYDEEWDELMSGNTLVRFTMEEGIENYHIDWMFIPADEYMSQKTLYEVRLRVYQAYLEVIEQAAEEGLNIDASAAEAIYNNPAATAEDLERAIGDLKYQVNVAQYKKLFEGATEDNPLEVTDICLKNADFSQGNIEGWLCTFQSGVNVDDVGYQDNNPWTNNGSTLTTNGSPTDEDGNPAYINQFIQAWRGNSNPWVIGDGELSQTIYGLPKGMYRLSCDAIAAHHHGKYSNPVKGAKLFISTDTGTEVYQELATQDWVPEHFTITFPCPQGVKALTFGLKAENTTANWIAADNFRIFYYGDGGSDIPELFVLRDQISKAEESGITGDDNANSEILSAFTKALDNARAIAAKANPTADECSAAIAALKTTLADAQQSIEDYITFKKIIDEALSLATQVRDAGFDEAATAVETLVDDWEVMYSERTATKEMIETFDGLAYSTMKEKVFGNIKPGTNLTFLLENPHFTRGGGGDLTGNAIPGWTVNSGRITDLRAAAHNIESWHASFDISQTLPDMPAGVYDITVQGFVSHDDGVTDLTWLYGGISTAYLIDQLADDSQKSLVPFYDSSKPSLGDDHYDFQSGEDEEGNPLYVCGGMTSAYYWFQETNPNTGEPYYTNHVKLLHEKQGDFTIGIHCESNNDWVIWDNFNITYIGQDNSVIAEQLQKSLEELAEVAEENDAFLTAKAIELIETLPVEAQKAIDDDDADVMLAKITEIMEAVDYVKEGNSLVANLLNMVLVYEETLNNLDELNPTDDSYAELLAKWDLDGGGDGNPAELADNDAVRALIEQIKNGWVGYVMSGATGASQNNPVMVTPVIVQPNYTDSQTGEYNENGWTTTIGTSGWWYAYPEIEFYDENFDHRQTIKGLTPGWYYLTLQGYYRAGYVNDATKAYVDSTYAYNATMFAIGVDSVSTKLNDIFVGAQEYPYNGSGEYTVTLADGSIRYVPDHVSAAYTYFDAELYENEIWVEVGEDGVLTIGVSKDQYISGDWTIFTNWNLWYAGPKGPDAVQRIETDTNKDVKAIYNLAGQKVSKTQKGIYIVNGRKVAIK